MSKSTKAEDLFEKNGQNSVSIFNVLYVLYPELPIVKSDLNRESDFKTHPILEKILISSGWYKTLVNTMPEGIVASDMNLNIIYVNPKICKMLGYKEDELLGMNSIDIVMESDRARVSRESEKRFTEKKRHEGYVFKCRILARDRGIFRERYRKWGTALT